MLMYIVGTPYTEVHLSTSIDVITSTGLKTSQNTMVTQWLMQAMTPKTHPKQWNRGTVMHRRSSAP